ncbi:MAG: thioredoxin family protein [Bacteroidales bacterium]|nr:thioredoxin family protein [Bacteroidales bacterium]
MQILTAILSLLLTATVPQQVDTAGFGALKSKVDEYCLALSPEPARVKMSEADYMIELCRDSLMRQFTALRFYDYYLNSKLMGDESVAVHLVDAWFASGKVKMKSDMDLLNAKVYAEFNRHSLLGMHAPVVSLEDASGAEVTIPAEGRYNVLYFYDTGCPTCKIETPVLMNIVRSGRWPVDFYAVYVGSDRELWQKYVQENLSDATYNLWDEDKSSDFQRLYGVLQTPKLFLTDKYGKIVGRGLDPVSLVKVLGNEFSIRDYEYGSEKSDEMFDKIIADGLTVGDFADYISEKTLVQKKDTVAFKELMGDLLYWAVSRRGYEAESAEISDRYVLEADPKIWCDPWDSLKVVGLAELRSSLAKLAPVGSKVPSVRVRSAGGKVNISKVADAYLIFHAPGCKVCEEALEKASKSGARVYEVNMDLQKESVRDRLLESFDISTMPLIVRVDKGIVKEQYVKEIL